MSTETATVSLGRATRHEFSFTGTAKEYFGIWIVNLLLSIVTIGIYTAWAKVRRLRYFYGNTWLDGHNFEYHAKPVQILIGRIIAVGLLILFNVLAEVFPLATLVLIVPYFLLLPWLINKAFAFNSRMTSYRNVRFGFVGKYRSALWVFIVLPLLVPVAIGLLVVGLVFVLGINEGSFDPDGSNVFIAIMIGIFLLLFVAAFLAMVPYISKKANDYIANGMRFGTAKFSADLPLKRLYANLGFAILPVLLVVLVGVLMAMVAQFAGLFESTVVASTAQLASVLVYIAAFMAYFIYAAGVRNIAFNATRIEGGHDLQSGIPRYGYAWVLVSNLFVSVITIGLMIPWAAIRTWRYLASYTAVNSASGLDQFTADQSAEGNVAAAEYLDIDGIDFGL